jgi:Protein of unknwon function (DUF3310)
MNTWILVDPKHPPVLEDGVNLEMRWKDGSTTKGPFASGFTVWDLVVDYRLLSTATRPGLPKAALDAIAQCGPALSPQEGGQHYKGMKIQPFEYIHANGLGFAEGCVVKYVSRWRAKNGVEDLKKARHFLDLLIEAEGGK